MVKLAIVFFVLAAICTLVGIFSPGTMIQVVGIALALIGAFILVIQTMIGGSR